MQPIAYFHLVVHIHGAFCQSVLIVEIGHIEQLCKAGASHAIGRTNMGFNPTLDIWLLDMFYALQKEASAGMHACKSRSYEQDLQLGER